MRKFKKKSKMPLLLCAIILHAGIIISAHAVDDYSQWSKNAAVTFNTTSSGSNITQNVLNFPVLIRLNPSNFSGFASTKPGGADLRFAKISGQHLSYQIERWVDGENNNDTADIWVKVDTVYGNDNSHYIKMYWGNSAAFDSSNSAAVFGNSNGFVGAWHLNNNPASTAPQIKDATSNSIHGTSCGNMQTSDLVAGTIGKGLHFDANDDYINLGNGSAVDITGHNSITLSAWVKFHNLNCNAWQQIIAKGDHQYALQKRVQNNKIQFAMYNSGKSAWDSVYSNSDVNTNDWYLASGVYNGSNDSMFLYVNGIKQTNKTKATSGLPSVHDDPLKLGKNSEFSDRLFNGVMDEAGLSNVARSADWIRLSYENQKAGQTLVTVSAPEDLTTWQYNERIRLDTRPSGANVANNVCNFPVLIRLNRYNFDFSQARGNGRDIRFTKPDSSKTLAFEIERWDSLNRVAEIWVKVDTVKGNDSSQYVRMFWGKSDAPAISSGASVFETSNSFVSVYHMKDPPGTTLDATANGLGAAAHGTGMQYQQIGVIGKSTSLGGNNDYFNAGNNSKFLMWGDKVTISAWVNRRGGSGPDGWEGIAGKYRWNGVNNREYMLSNNAENGFVFAVSTDGTSGQETYIYGNTVPTNGSWYHLVGTCDGGSNVMKFYVNGVLKGSAAKNGINTSDADFKIGLTDSSAYAKQMWNGFIDEVTVSSTSRSADWVKLSYENQKASQTLVNVPSIVENYATWYYSRKVHFNTTESGSNVTGDVYNFPLLIRLDTITMIFSQAADDGRDIRFSDPDGKHLNYEIESWDAVNKKASVWVKVPKIDGNSTSDYITVYYGNPNAQDMQARDSVWDSTFAGVWHLNQTPPDQISDATSNGYNGTAQGGMTYSDQVSGTISGSLKFNGTNSYVNVLNSSGLNPKKITVSAWAKPNAWCNDYTPLVSKQENASPWKIFDLRRQPGSQNIQAAIAVNGSEYMASGGEVSTGAWQQLAFTYDGETIKVFNNGAKTGINTSPTGDLQAGSSNLNFGRNSSYTSRFFNGTLDEIQISNVARDSNWMKLSYASQRSDESMVTIDSAVVRSYAVDSDSDGVQDIIEGKYAKNPLDRASFPFIAIVDSALLMRPDTIQKVTYNYKYIPDLSNCDEITMVIPPNTIAAGQLPPMIEPKDTLADGTTPVLPGDPSDYSWIGKVYKITGTLEDNAALSVPLPISYTGMHIGNQFIAVHYNDDGSIKEYCTVDSVTPKAVYVHMESFSLVSLFEVKDVISAEAYVDGQSAYGYNRITSTAQVIVDFKMTYTSLELDNDINPNGYFIINYTPENGTPQSKSYPFYVYRGRSYRSATFNKVFNFPDNCQLTSVEFYSTRDLLGDQQYPMTRNINITLDNAKCVTVTANFERGQFSLSNINSLISVKNVNASNFQHDFYNISTSFGVEGRLQEEIQSVDETVFSNYYYIKDHLGSTRLTVEGNDADFDPVEATMYESYGAMTPVAYFSADQTKEKFTGKEFDEEGAVAMGGPGMDLFYFGRRYYDPEIGMFTSADPEEQDWSGYAYCSGDPINFIDPFGLADIGITPEMVTQDINNMIAYTNALEASISNIPMGTLFSAVMGSDPTRFSSYYLNWNSSTEGAYVAAPIEGAGMASAPLVIGGAAPPVTDVARSAVTSAPVAGTVQEAASTGGEGAGLANLHPLGNASYIISSPYGPRPSLGGFHYGIDYAVPVGTPIYAVNNGVVTFAGLRGGYGDVIYYTVGNNTYVNGHLRNRLVRTGDRLARGQLIAYSGRSGHVTGPHLHFEIRNNSGTYPTNTINPQTLGF